MNQNDNTPAPAPTPRTDAEAYEATPCHYDGHTVVNSNFARTLERELAQANAELARLDKENKTGLELLTNVHTNANQWRADAAHWQQRGDAEAALRYAAEERGAALQRDLAATKAALAEAQQDKGRLIDALNGILLTRPAHGLNPQARMDDPPDVKIGWNVHQIARAAIDAARAEREGGGP